jgi:hypothetical protein
MIEGLVTAETFWKTWLRIHGVKHGEGQAHTQFYKPVG